MAAVALEGVSKKFSGSVPAVRDLHLEIHDRELVVLVGPSGCGKTTTLRLIAGLEDPDQGVIRIGGQVVNRRAPRERDIAMVFQPNVLYPHMTVARNMAAGLMWRYGRGWWRRGWMRCWHPVAARRYDRWRRGVNRQVSATARLLGIDHLLERYPAELSGGESQRVALGRVIVRRPAAFLFDEPLSHLDAPLRVEMRREIRRVHERFNSTMIYVTHDQAEATSVGDRLVVMQDGQIQQSGSPRQVYDRPATTFVARFIGSPGMNLITGTWERCGAALRFTSGDLTCSIPYPPASPGPETHGAQVTLGFRPEYGRVVPQPPVASAEVPARGNGNRQDDSLAVSGRVVRSEFLGGSTLLHVALAARANQDHNNSSPRRLTDSPRRRIELAVMVPVREAPEVGQQISIGIDPARLHFFHAQTGHRLAVSPVEWDRSAGQPRAGCEPDRNPGHHESI